MFLSRCYYFAFLQTTGMCSVTEKFFFFQICFLKSPLNALIVTGFCCFPSETRLYKKHTETGKK